MKSSIRFRELDKRENLFESTISSLSSFVFKATGRDLMSRLLNDRSVLRNELSKKLRDSQIQPFIWLLKKLRDSKTALTPGPIHESFIVVTGSTLSQHLHASAQLNAHSPNTHMDTYLSRYPRVVKEKLVNTPSLAVRVGELMTEFAQRIIDLEKEFDVLKVNQVKAALGLNHIGDDIQDLYANINQVGILGELENIGRKIYIADPSCAALIIRYLEHIKCEVPRVIQHQRTDTRKTKEFILEFIRLSEILRKFPQNMIKEGERLASKLPNDLFPPLV